MAPQPAPLSQLAGRRICFEPPIYRSGSNEWLCLRTSWNEALLVSRDSDDEICVPSRFLGRHSELEDDVLVIELVRELEYRDGAVRPRERRVIEFPSLTSEHHIKAVGSQRSLVAAPAVANVVNIRLEPKREIGKRKWIGVGLVLTVVAFTLVNDIARASRAYRALAEGDRYRSILSKLALLK